MPGHRCADSLGYGIELLAAKHTEATQNSLMNSLFHFNRLASPAYSLTNICQSEMAPVTELEARETVERLLIKRKNWAAHEAGVVLVFCIVFIVASGLLGLCISRAIKKRREARGQS